MSCYPDSLGHFSLLKRPEGKEGLRGAVLLVDEGTPPHPGARENSNTHGWSRRRGLTGHRKGCHCLSLQGLIFPFVGWLVSHGVGLSSLKEAPCHPPAGPGGSLLILPSGWRERSRSCPAPGPVLVTSACAPGLEWALHSSCPCLPLPAPVPVPRCCCLVPEADPEPGLSS